MNLWKRVIQRKLSLAYFLISLLFIVAGFWFAIPRLKGLGITWTLISVVMGIYYGLDLFTKRESSGPLKLLTEKQNVILNHKLYLL
ncbi:hypothetical protein P7H25_13435 [Paenibacillus larvae]|nr:hypothetical protein [Paenibacillus larvae]MDT2256422.1 hypothetical protein [Paenibacillus larvae]MDT2303362.1 hypothetical protein [Paenibacillus larvae]